MKQVLSLLIGLCAGHAAFAQAGFDSLLSNIRQNNPGLRTAGQYGAARNAEYRTGLSLYDPTIDFDYYKGSPSTAGNQINLELSQSFDFPTVYRYRRELSRLQIRNTPTGIARQRQETLLEAKLLYIDIVFGNRQAAILRKRLTLAQNLERDFRRKLDAGEGNVLDLNKARIQTAQLQVSLRLIAASQAVAAQRLQAMNGGAPIAITDTTYPAHPQLPEFRELEATIEASDPTLQSLEGVVQISEAQLRLQRALMLPRLEAGYFYQGILGQTFNGVHTGISLPLWEKKNTVRFREAQLAAERRNIEAHRTDHFHEVKALYQQFKIQDSAYGELHTLLLGLSSEYLLEKAFRLGELSSIEFFMELKYFYDSYDRLLELDRDRQQTMARLTRYML